MDYNAQDYIYIIELEASKIIKMKIKYAVVCFIIALSTYGVGFIKTDSSANFFVTVPYAFSIVPIAFLLVGSFNVVGMVDFMMYKTYKKAFIWIKKTTYLLLFLLGICTGAELVFIISHRGQESVTNEYIFFAGIFISLILDVYLCTIHRGNMKLIKKQLRSNKMNNNSIQKVENEKSVY